MNRALIFDCDGVLADTERDGHLVAFNRLFGELGLDLQWSPDDYARLLRIAGGKERLRALFADAGWVARNRLPEEPGEQRRLIATWHRRKTEIFLDLVASGAVAPRPGVARLAAEAQAAGWQTAVASTASDEAVRSLVARVFPVDSGAAVRVFAGDIVARKKPAPDIYLLALAELGRAAGEVCVVEDSRQGLLAARRAGSATIITVSGFTADDDFSGAALVVDSLGDEGHPVRVLQSSLAEPPGGLITLETCEAAIRWAENDSAGSVGAEM